MKRFLIALGAVLLATTTAAQASHKVQMPADLIGEWCYDQANDPKTFHGDESYQLPSWTDGPCEKDRILSITPYYFTLGGSDYQPLKVTVKEDCAPSGCEQDVVVVARAPELEIAKITFKFSHYKGNLTVTYPEGD